jgi:hypothetical protein
VTPEEIKEAQTLLDEAVDMAGLVIDRTGSARVLYKKVNCRMNLGMTPELALAVSMVRLARKPK